MDCSFSELYPTEHVGGEGQPVVQDHSLLHSSAESEPLLLSPGPSSYSNTPRRLASPVPWHLTTNFQTSLQKTNRQYPDEPYCLHLIMEKIQGTKVGKALKKVAVDSGEVGLSNVQLMLCNYDLIPVEPERRQWRDWNFVGFWIADSFNIVRIVERNMDLNGLTDI